MNKNPNRQASVDSRRIALEREINIRFAAFDTFVTEYSANVSTTGMFIVSEEPRPPGTEFNFEFSVADDWKLIHGRGQVVWTRYKAEGPNRPAGMGIRFRELDSQSRRLIRWIVEKHIREGGKPFELEELRSAIDDALDQVVEKPAGMVAEAPRPSAPIPGHISAVRSVPAAAAPAATRPRRRLPAGLLTVIGVGAIVAGLVWLSEVAPNLGEAEGEVAESATGTQGGGEATVAAAGESGGEGTPTAADPGTTAEPASGTVPAASEAVGPSAAAVAAAVSSWSNAWSEQDVEAYLAHYSSAFQPPDGESLASWRSQRSDRIRRPRFIRIAISRLETRLPADERAEAVFYQTYRSNTYADEVRKMLEFVWENGSWKIARERVVG